LGDRGITCARTNAHIEIRDLIADVDSPINIRSSVPNQLFDEGIALAVE